MISFLQESWFPKKRNIDFHTPDRWWISPRIIHPDKIKLRVRFSLDNLKLDDDVLNIPLSAISTKYLYAVPLDIPTASAILVVEG